MSPLVLKSMEFEVVLQPLEHSSNPHCFTHSVSINVLKLKADKTEFFECSNPTTEWTVICLDFLLASTVMPRGKPRRLPSPPRAQNYNARDL